MILGVLLLVLACLPASFQFRVRFVLELLVVFEAVCSGTGGGQLFGLHVWRCTLHVPVC